MRKGLFLLPLALPVAVAATGALYRPMPGPLRLARQIVDVDGAKMSFAQSGEGKRDVVLIHGGMGSAEDFEPVLPALSPRYRVTAVDRPGFGASQTRGDDYTYPGNARAVLGLVRALHLVQPIVVGHSHGGGVALQMAADAPSELGGLVLVASAAFPVGKGPGALDRLTATPYLGEGIAAWVGPFVAPGMIRRILTYDLGPNATPRLADFLSYRAELFNNPTSLATHARQEVTNDRGLTALAPRLGAIQVPAVVLWCDSDPNEGRGLDSPRLAKTLPKAREVKLTGCGHYVQFIHPEALVEAVKSLQPD